MFPWCTTPARRCDCDHTTAYDSGGATCPDNLAPLCHHHRLKTHARWRYRRIEAQRFLWTSPQRRPLPP